jgi:hypothetical protein
MTIQADRSYCSLKIPAACLRFPLKSDPNAFVLESFVVCVYGMPDLLLSSGGMMK